MLLSSWVHPMVLQSSSGVKLLSGRSVVDTRKSVRKRVWGDEREMLIMNR
jgi:hypothetical protein